MNEYAVIYEQGPANWSAYVPDLPGCVSTGRSFEEVRKNMREAIELHLEGMREDGEPIPTASTRAEQVPVSI